MPVRRSFSVVGLVVSATLTQARCLCASQPNQRLQPTIRFCLSRLKRGALRGGSSDLAKAGILQSRARPHSRILDSLGLPRRDVW